MAFAVPIFNEGFAVPIFSEGIDGDLGMYRLVYKNRCTNYKLYTHLYYLALNRQNDRFTHLYYLASNRETRQNDRFDVFE